MTTKEPNVFHIRNPEESNLCSGLYLVPTPIGNLRDITLRALDVLSGCDAIICEDSRVTGKLLKAYNIVNKKKIVYNDHADDAAKEEILRLIEEGNILAFVSDAGTPMISDPGYKLVRSCIENGLYVTALPGANAVLPALQLSAMPTDSFIFAGFLPSKDKGVRDAIENYKSRLETIIFYESPKRIAKTLMILKEIMPTRKLAVVREISKLYEEAIHMTAVDLADYIAENPVKGEVALVLHGASNNKPAGEIDLELRVVEELKKGRSIKDISTLLSMETGLKKKDVYSRVLDIKENHSL